MSTFYFQQPQKKSSILQNNLWALWISLAIFKLITWFDTSNKLDLLITVCFLLAGAFSFFRKKKQIKSYITIHQNGIEWTDPTNIETGDLPNPVLIEWTKIIRIKFEDDGVSLYQESSFNNFISFKKLVDSDRIACINEIAEQAKVHVVEMINK